MREAIAGPENTLSPAGVWCSLHGDQCQDWHECGVGLFGNCQVRAERGSEGGQGEGAWVGVGGNLGSQWGGGGGVLENAWLYIPSSAHDSSCSRELKYRAGRQPDEPSFQIRDYVESQKKRPSCCSFV